jgi:hypothetical protein
VEQVSEQVDDGLPVFAVSGWSGSVGVGRVSRTSMAELATGRIVDGPLTSVAIGHRDEQGHQIEICSHRPADRPELKRWAPVNTMLAWLRNREGGKLSARKFNRLADDLQADIAEGRRPWVVAQVPVDDQGVEFEVMRFDDTFWAAVGYLDDLHITIASAGVPIAGLALERTTVRDIEQTLG